MKMTSDVARRAVYLTVFAVMASSVTAGSYFLLARLLRDRQSAMTHTERLSPAELRQRQAARAAKADGTTTTRTVNQTPGSPSATAAGEAAIQRQLKTLEEINKINEMNRRLQEQQQRMQNQR